MKTFKRVGALLLTVIMLLTFLSGCAAKHDPEASETHETEPAPDGGQTGETAFAEGTTVMIYMVGSDLESTTAAATRDLEEILESGVDLGANRLYVYAGGTEAWHNDFASKEINTVLRLTPAGFETAAEHEKVSMGKPETLSWFVNYCTENSPSEHYALIFWDHGAGPLMGCGKDTAFENDWLTLNEMREAMEKTRFGADKKLDWVGFDACLMSSAELIFVWDDYADYLVSSQEVELNGGWDYAFLGQLGKCDDEELLAEIADGYIAACLAYYERKGVSGNDVTLSVVDLSCGEQLREALNALFSAAAGDVRDSYGAFTRLRVATRELGKISTNSNYDLVDLKDLALKFGQDYPEESQALLDALSSAVITNKTNAEDLCGVSLYYPFNNKTYYTKMGWSGEYRGLSDCESYIGYLDRLDDIWLSGKLPEDYAVPVELHQDGSTISMQLTPEQQAYFAYSRYYVLKKTSNGRYSGLLLSAKIDYNDGVLSTDCDWRTIYIVDDYGNSAEVVAVQMDDNSGEEYYQLLATSLTGRVGISEGDDEKLHSAQIYLKKVPGSDELQLVTVTHELSDGDELNEGKTEVIDLADWETLNVLAYPESIVERYPSKSQNKPGAIKPYLEWPKVEQAAMSSFNIADGLHFYYAPLESGEYSVLFQIMDIGGNCYCSELLPCTVENEHYTFERRSPKPAKKTIDWNDTAEKVLFDEESIRLTAKIKYSPEEGQSIQFCLRNGTEHKLYCSVEDLVLNGNIICESDFLMICDPGEDEYQTLSFGCVEETNEVRAIESLDFSIDILDNTARRSVVRDQEILFRFADGIFEPDFVSNVYTPKPFCGALAEEQLLYEDEFMRVTLLGFPMDCDSITMGDLEVSSAHFCIRVENLSSDRYCTAELRGVSFNGWFAELDSGDFGKTIIKYSTKPVPPHGVLYRDAYFDPGMLAASAIYYIDTGLFDSIINLNTQNVTFNMQSWGDIFYRIYDSYIARNIGGISDIKLLLETKCGNSSLSSADTKRQMVDVLLSQKSNAPMELPFGSKSLCSGRNEGLNVRISIWDKGQPQACLTEDVNQTVYLTVRNDSNRDIRIRIADCSLDGIPQPMTVLGTMDNVRMMESTVGAGQSAVIMLVLVYDDAHDQMNPYRYCSIRFRITDIDGMEELWHSNDPVTISLSD